jgi:hypothetical protein
VITGFAPPRPEADRGADRVKVFAGAVAVGAASSDPNNTLVGGAPDPEDAIVGGASSTRAREKAKAKAWWGSSRGRCDPDGAEVPIGSNGRCRLLANLPALAVGKARL